jgi:Kae1-associated kinase Bud32
MEAKTIFQGAEAIILLDKKEIIKKRIKKSYRIAELDERIRKLRTRSETKLLDKASKVIPVPKVKKTNEEDKEIIMDFIDGKKLSDSLDDFPIENQLKIFKQIGNQIAKLHDSDIIHGDLTTSNMILVEALKNGEGGRGVGCGNNKIYFVDFGLGFGSHKIEDKAVDLHLLKQALEAKHFKHSENLFEEVVKGYEASKDSKEVFERFKKVEKRGRYKNKD